MKKAITMLVALALICGLCASCKKEADQPPKPEPAQQPEAQAKDWEPETAQCPVDDHDHSHDGHDHTEHSH